MPTILCHLHMPVFFVLFPKGMYFLYGDQGNFRKKLCPGYGFSRRQWPEALALPLLCTKCIHKGSGLAKRRWSVLDAQVLFQIVGIRSEPTTSSVFGSKMASLFKKASSALKVLQVSPLFLFCARWLPKCRRISNAGLYMVGKDKTAKCPPVVNR